MERANAGLVQFLYLYFKEKLQIPISKMNHGSWLLVLTPSFPPW